MSIPTHAHGTYTSPPTNSVQVRRRQQFLPASGRTRFPPRSLFALIYSFALFALNSSVGRAAYPGELDPTFGIRGAVQMPDQILVQADGRIVLGSDSPSKPSVARLHRYLPDGSLDPTFDTTGLGLARFWEMADAGGGRLYVRVTPGDGPEAQRVIRIQSSGLLDPTFVAGVTNEIEAISAQPDGRLIIKTFITSGLREEDAPGDLGNHILRLRDDGSLDDSFHAVTNAVMVNSLSVQRDGKIYLWGQMTEVNGVRRFGLARLLEDGSLDRAFNPVRLRWSESQLPWISDVSLTPQRKVLVFGAFDYTNGVVRKNFAMLRYDGSMDESFSPPPMEMACCRGFVQKDEKVVLIGQFSKVGRSARNSLARLNADGSVDESYLVSLPQGEAARLGALLPNDDLLVAGNTSRNILAKVRPGQAQEAAPVLVRPPVSQIRVRGQSVVFEGQVRSNPSANYQWRFNGRDLPGVVECVLSLSHLDYPQMGTYQLVAKNSLGEFTSPPAHLIVNAEPVAPGALDLSFDPGEGPDMSIRRIATQGDKAIILGDFRKYRGQSVNGLARILPDGQLDSSFRHPAQPWSALSALALDSSDRIYVGGGFCRYNDVERCGLVRLNPDGEVDVAYVPEVPPGTRIADLALLGGGRILIAGAIGEFNPFIAVLDAAGKGDPSFAKSANDGPSIGSIHRLAVYPDGRFLAAGIDPEGNPDMRRTVRRFLANGEIDRSFQAQNLYARSFGQMLATTDGGAWIHADFFLIKMIGNERFQASLLHLQPDGTIDPRPPVFRAPVSGLGRFPNGDIVVSMGAMNGWTPDGRKAPQLHDIAYGASSIAFDKQGRLLAAGGFEQVNHVPRHNLARIHTSEQTPQAVLWGPFLSGSGFELSLPTVTNRTYSLESSSQLESNNWATVLRIAGNGNWQGVSDPETNSPAKFYRLRVEPPNVKK